MNHSSHLTDEELVGCYWETSETIDSAHLTSCPECAERSRSLARDLKQIGLNDAPACQPGFADKIWQNIRAEIHAHPARQSTLKRFLSLAFSFPARPRLRVAAFASVTALLIGIAFFAGRQWEKNSATHPPIQSAHTDKPHQPSKSPVVVVLLDDHLDRSEQLLVELKHADAGDEQSLAPMREEAKILLVANRKVIQQPSASNNPQMQATLTKLDHLLVKLASDSGNFTPDELVELQDELNSNKLLFEIRVLRTNTQNPSERSSTVHPGGSI